VVGGLAIATPAQAGGPAKEHYALWQQFGPSYEYWYWIDEIEGIIGCPKCFYLLQFVEPEENPHWQGGLMEGLNQLSEASVAADEGTAAALQARALESFTEAARGLDGATLLPGVASAFDPDSGREFAIDAPWLDAAQADIAEGMAARQRSLDDPQPEPWKQYAARKFNEAFTELSTKKAL
jgi:hypothetical protein